MKEITMSTVKNVTAALAFVGALAGPALANNQVAEQALASTNESSVTAIFNAPSVNSEQAKAPAQDKVALSNRYRCNHSDYCTRR
jgi:hypothetical protein